MPLIGNDVHAAWRRMFGEQSFPQTSLMTAMFPKIQNGITGIAKANTPEEYINSTFNLLEGMALANPSKYNVPVTGIKRFYETFEEFRQREYGRAAARFMFGTRRPRRQRERRF